MTSLTESKDIKNPKELSSNKWCNNQIPISFEYHEDADAFLIDFIKPSLGIVRSTNEINNERNILVSYDSNNKIVSIEILEASELLHQYLVDTQATLDSKHPPNFYPIHYKNQDKLIVYFIDINSFNIPSIKYQKTKEKDFELGMDGEKIFLLLFHNVSNRIAKSLSEEERIKLAKDVELSRWERRTLSR
ncbi:hypothetical protein RhiirA5_349331 [Rhizophagus irregularis]|nr:hypothetical protein RirG_022720 [Rhizophagus irregularis DAOM 197198w]PKC15281.1 hypothetical protein RhiirA5_349331 [Rhizophagus irregularis]GBC37838.1 hypothetical protein GLOIN_2v1687539 [Rhizophagus irregularis DAOM 181602=DAOM 197198]PKC65798.1 hypothetical protein RhiirA1_420034 [Rhizophagus irregularis]PKK73503.1 hypothetical protein RhiirC2_740631 [Rhizophagus irregularis]